MNNKTYEQARQARDPRFDGRFFVGVKTTGVYCRPVCPVKMPRAANVLFFATAAAAAEAGFRPCLRCRPETAPGTPAWQGTSTTVARGLRLIGQGALDEGSVEALSDRLGVSARHLRRLFIEHLGASPIAIAQTRRLHFAKRLIDETAMTMTDIALASGYGSVRRFNHHFQQVYGRTPRELRGRRREQPSPASTGAFVLRLPFRQPFDADAVFGFLAGRATPGVEQVAAGIWSRTIRLGDERGSICVRAGEREMICEVQLPSAKALMQVASRVREVFDLNADPGEIDDSLARDEALAPLVAAHPGRRLPGAWDPFEVAVRAIVGQQVSVKGATTIMGRIAQRYGEAADGRLWFPAPSSLSQLDPATLPMPRQRAEAIRELARRVESGDVDLGAPSLADLQASLVAIRGIGNWTAQYIAMRAIGDPDAFLSGDLVLQRVARHYLGLASERELLERAEAWRPWRAYAGVHLWSIADRFQET